MYWITTASRLDVRAVDGMTGAFTSLHVCPLYVNIQIIQDGDGFRGVMEGVRTILTRLESIATIVGV